jgi:hypothetical protein
MSASQVDPVALVAQHGMLLESAHGPIPNLARLIAGEPIPGSWWAHPTSHEIFTATMAVRGAEAVVTLRLVGGKVTFVHRRLWPALVRLADRTSSEALAAIEEEHTPSGRHVVHSHPFPAWVPPEVTTLARALSEEEALRLIPAASCPETRTGERANLSVLYQHCQGQSCANPSDM